MIVGEDIGQISGTVQSVLFKGVHYEMMIDTGETVFKVHSTVMQPQGSSVGLNIVPYNIHIMKPMRAPVAFVHLGVIFEHDHPALLKAGKGDLIA